MRLPTELVVKALLRRAASAGCPGYVVRHGDDERGALYVKVSLLDGRARLVGPAPAGFDTSDDSTDRDLVPHLAPEGAPESEIDQYMRRQMEFDSDLWLVEIEDREGRCFLAD